MWHWTCPICCCCFCCWGCSWFRCQNLLYEYLALISLYQASDFGLSSDLSISCWWCFTIYSIASFSFFLLLLLLLLLCQVWGLSVQWPCTSSLPLVLEWFLFLLGTKNMSWMERRTCDFIFMWMEVSGKELPPSTWKRCGDLITCERESGGMVLNK